MPPTHALAGKTSVKLKDVLDYPFICREEGSGTREVVLDYLYALGMDKHAMNACLELGSPEAVKGAVEAGMGVSIVSSASIGKELRLGSSGCHPAGSAIDP